MKLKVLPLSLFLYKSHFFNLFFLLLMINIDLAGNVWFGQDASISSKNTESTITTLARNSLSLTEGGIYHFHTHLLVLM